MALHADSDLGVHQGRRRILELDINDCALVNQNLAALAAVDSAELYAPGFTHFAGQLSADRPGAATTLSIRIVPQIVFSLGAGGPPIAPAEFEVALLTLAAGVNEYCFYWGEGRGLLVDIAAVTGANYCFSPRFRVRVRNTGAFAANAVTLEAVLCQ